MKKIYIAGPDVFRTNARDYGKSVKDLLSVRGMQGLYPFDNEVGFDPNDKRGTAKKIYEANIQMIRDCDAVLANISPFRGPSLDPGTAFEIGFAVALGKPVVGYTDVGADLETRTRVYGPYISDMVYPMIENFGLTDNLMIEFGCNKIVAKSISLNAALKVLVKLLDLTPTPIPEDQL